MKLREAIILLALILSWTYYLWPGKKPSQTVLTAGAYHRAEKFCYDQRKGLTWRRGDYDEIQSVACLSTNPSTGKDEREEIPTYILHGENP
jgi:hypothetical protein